MPATPTRLGPFFLHLAMVAAAGWLFLLGLDLLGETFKMGGKETATTIFASTANPIVGLMMGVLATSIVQSSSTTTSLIVALVAAGRIEVAWAVPMVMGANIGTTVTNTLVSFGHVRNREAFERAYAGAVVDDVFNILAVLIFLPLKVATNFLGRGAEALASLVGGDRLDATTPSLLDVIIAPVTHTTLELIGALAGGLLGVGAIILALMALVHLLEKLMLERVKQVLGATLFRNIPVALGVGLLGTAILQSSSVTLSLIVPLLGTGVLSLTQVFPYAVGANTGTTLTATLAALATVSPAALAVAFSHLLFNVCGALVFIPLRRVPLGLSEQLAHLAARHRRCRW